MSTQRVTYERRDSYEEAWMYLTRTGQGFSYSVIGKWVYAEPSGVASEDKITMDRLNGIKTFDELYTAVDI